MIKVSLTLAMNHKVVLDGICNEETRMSLQEIKFVVIFSVIGKSL
jgi:hypothetical protein